MLKFSGGLRPLGPVPVRVPQPLTLHLAVVVIMALTKSAFDTSKRAAILIPAILINVATAAASHVFFGVGHLFLVMNPLTKFSSYFLKAS